MKRFKKDILNIFVYIFRFRRKNYIYYKGFYRKYPSGVKVYVKPSWKKHCWHSKNPRWKRAMEKN